MEGNDERMPAVELNNTGLSVKPCEAGFGRLIVIDRQTGDKLAALLGAFL